MAPVLSPVYLPETILGVCMHVHTDGFKFQKKKIHFEQWMWKQPDSVKQHIHHFEQEREHFLPISLKTTTSWKYTSHFQRSRQSQLILINNIWRT